MLGMKPNYKEGDLVTIIRCESLTLCQLLTSSPPAVRECPIKDLAVPSYYDDIYKNLEGKMGLVVYIARNKLDQPLGYRVLIEGHEMFCKSKVAQKYFKLTENQGDESR